MKIFGSISRLVSLLFRKDSQDITVRPNQATTYSASRDIQLPPGDAAHVLVSADSTQTFTNKSISGSTNTITNVSLTSGVTGTLPVANGGTNSATSLSNNRVIKSSAGAIVEAAAITAARALISDANGIPTHSAVTATELGYVAGVTSSIQTQLDAVTTGMSWHVAVRAHSKTNVIIASELENGDSLQGLTLATGDRVLLSGQTTDSQNGIYIVAVSGAASRAADADTFGELQSAAVFVAEGTYADQGYLQTTELSAFTGQVWSQIAGVGTYTADGNGIEVTGSAPYTFSLELDGSTLSKSATGLKVATGGITNTEVSASAAIALSKIEDFRVQANWVTGDGTSKAITHSFGTKDIVVQVYDKTDDQTIFVDTIIRTDTNTVTLTSSEAPGASGWRVLVMNAS